jgi:hypothetical protein
MARRVGYQLAMQMLFTVEVLDVLTDNHAAQPMSR